jgi:nucleoside phosphorylase/CheY-like chemotaxis protein
MEGSIGRIASSFDSRWCQMKLLLVEDMQSKAQRILEVLSATSAAYAEVTRVEDIVSAKRALSAERFDALILDLQLPMRSGDEVQKLGGKTLLQEILASDFLLRPRYILGISEYPESIELAESTFADNLFGLLDSSALESEWKPRLLSFLEHVASATQVQSNPNAPSGYGISLAIVCALHTPELEAVLQLPCQWMEITGNSCNPTFQALLVNGGGTHRVVAVSALEMGMPAAAALAAKTIEKYRPRYVAMTGIAGGIKGSGGFGDVVVADSCWDYSGGKVIEKNGVVHIENEPRTAELDPTLKSQFMRLINDNSLLARVAAGYNGDLPETRLSGRVGPIFTGTHVITSEQRAKELTLLNRKLSAIDMEGYAIFASARYAEQPRPSPLLLKGLSDFADKEKDDRWRKYASYTSARLLFAWAERHL